jgi:hypothetical protein
VDYNGSLTFNVYYGGQILDAFTAYPTNEGEAFQDILEWIDEQIECGNYSNG